MSDAWRAGHNLLRERIAAIPDALRGLPPLVPLPIQVSGAQEFVVTGVGSSAAHARYLAALLRTYGVRAEAVPVSCFLAPFGSREQVLIVFSQGLSPNARLALADIPRWRHVIVVTASHEQAALERLRNAGATIITSGGESEFGTLIRVIGPMAGYLVALRLAAALGGHPTPNLDLDLDDLCRCLADATQRSEATIAAIDVQRLRHHLAFVTCGTYAELVSNLQYKVLEGMLLPAPGVWDLFHLAHGPLQQAFDGEATFLALTRPDAVGEQTLLGRFQQTLDLARHQVIELAATLPGPLAIFEHETMLNALVLHYIAANHIDQVDWPGRGKDTPLYKLDAPLLPHRLSALTWPELERTLAEGKRTAVIGLGAIEQHGPHLPFATDTLIADALAGRVAAALGDAVALPSIALGCSREHMGFPGTVTISEPTLVALLTETLHSLRQHGFTNVFLFTAHGGNYDLLRRALPTLRAAAAPLAITAFTDSEGLATRLHATAGALGVTPESAGHHAGELETSIMLALSPADVRRSALRPGITVPTAAPPNLFYPSLRAHAPEGTVGDPRDADRRHGARYLEVWVEVLLAAYRAEKNARYTIGTQKP